MSAESVPTPPITPPGRGKKIVIFADGTGNSFATQESNIWRLYCALDKTEMPKETPDELQLARYIPGVGTSSNRLIRAIDGATGIGVPSNVRKLYLFLCWNWQPGGQDLPLRLLARGVHGADPGRDVALSGPDADDDR